MRDNQSLSSLFIDAGRLRSGDHSCSQPLVFVDLHEPGVSIGEIRLPSCPVIGVGDASHPLAAQLDAIVEAPASVEAIAQQAFAMPRAAAVTVQLLRLLPGLAPEAGLSAESMAYAMLQGSAEHRAWLGGIPERPATAADAGRIGLSRDNGRLVITLDRPDGGNAIDRAMRDGLHEAFSLAAIDPEIEEVALRAAGKAFSLGAELSEFGTTTDPATAHAIRCLTLPARMAMRCADRLKVHVQGACVGAGLELAAWGSRVIASPNAWFQLPELAMGILPGAGGCVSLTRRIGRQRTALLILSGKRLSARLALEWGLIDAIVDDPA